MNYLVALNYCLTKPPIMKSSYLNKVKTLYSDAEHYSDIANDIVKYIKKGGYGPSQVMAANSVCSDDLVTMQFTEPHKKMLGPFNMGGLNGFPFTGSTGLGAFAHHVTDDGSLLIIYAPHIGVTKKGKPGYVRRPGQSK